MANLTREEHDAKLETIELRMDSRIESMASTLDAFAAVQAERDKRLEATISQIASTLSSTKTTVIVTAFSAVLATVLGTASFNATLLSNMLAAFQAGKTELSAPPNAATGPKPTLNAP